MKKIIFDLDRTLWKCTVEVHPRLTLPRVHPETYDILKYLQDRGHCLNIASRSSEPEKCRRFLSQLFPSIRFTRCAIYPSQYNKNNHILDVNAHKEPFLFFDDESRIIESIQKCYPLSTAILCTQPLHWGLIDKRLDPDHRRTSLE